jgi:uncharacterized protein (TIGR00375 family)
LLLVPSIEGARRVNCELAKIGRLTSDGRPILGASASEAVSAMWTVEPNVIVIPAHIWTPWYSVFGAKSGFASLEECFGEHAKRITAIETGLSSDPSMNRRWSALDRLRLVSCSDAHSPEKLAREATIFDLDEPTFQALARALESGDGYEGTIEFYPEAGKYHHDGHRACGVAWTPQETRRSGGICPVCGKPVTIGVLHRVEELCDRDHPSDLPASRHVVPLTEILSQVHGTGPDSKRVGRTYEVLIEQLGSELSILLDLPADVLRRETDRRIAEAILAAREGRLEIHAGYDGVYGRVRIRFPDDPAR